MKFMRWSIVSNEHRVVYPLQSIACHYYYGVSLGEPGLESIQCPCIDLNLYSMSAKLVNRAPWQDSARRELELDGVVRLSAGYIDSEMAEHICDCKPCALVLALNFEPVGCFDPQRSIGILRNSVNLRQGTCCIKPRTGKEQQHDENDALP